VLDARREPLQADKRLESFELDGGKSDKERRRTRWRKVARWPAGGTENYSSTLAEPEHE
jgi:hypothetical protein